MSNLEASYNLILNNLRDISETEDFYFKPIKPKLSDIELIGLIILAEFKSIVVDSMPLEVCKISRSSRSRICKDVDYAYPNKGFCASQNLHFYGYKLHAVCSISGVFQSFDISPASVHDIHYLQDIKLQMSDCVLLGDKGYLSQTIQLDLFQ